MDPETEELIKNGILVITSVVTLASSVTAALKQAKDGTVKDKIRTVLNVLALNLGNAKNERKA